MITFCGRRIDPTIQVRRLLARSGPLVRFHTEAREPDMRRKSSVETRNWDVFKHRGRSEGLSGGPVPCSRQTLVIDPPQAKQALPPEVA